MASKEVTFIGIHVRRTDYIDPLVNQHKIGLAGLDYFTRAIDYYRTRFEVKSLNREFQQP